MVCTTAEDQFLRNLVPTQKTAQLLLQDSNPCRRLGKFEEKKKKTFTQPKILAFSMYQNYL